MAAYKVAGGVLAHHGVGFAAKGHEGGTDIRFIQNLLGHTSIRTTERYTHVARHKALAVQSPLDTPGD